MIALCRRAGQAPPLRNISNLPLEKGRGTASAVEGSIPQSASLTAPFSKGSLEPVGADEGIGPYDARVYLPRRRGRSPDRPEASPYGKCTLQGQTSVPTVGAAACPARRHHVGSTRSPGRIRKTQVPPRGRIISAPTAGGDIRASRYACAGSRLCGPPRASAPAVWTDIFIRAPRRGTA